MGNLYEDLCTFVIISRSVLLRIRNISDKICRENQNTHFVSSNISFLLFFFTKNRAFCEIMRKSMVHPDKSQVTVWRMRIACWLTKATDIQSKYLILVVPGKIGDVDTLQCYVYTYIACLIIHRVQNKMEQ